MGRLRSWGLFVAGGLVALVAAPGAFAGADPASDVYAGVAGNVQSDVASGALGTAPADGTLPFTGLNLALIVIGGIALIALGLVLRRRSATEH